MSRVICSRLESTIVAGQDLIQQLYKSSTRVHLDALYMDVLSTCSNGDEALAGGLLGTIVVLNEPATPALLAKLLNLPSQTVVTHLQTFVNERLLTTEDPLDSITDSASLRVCHHSLCDYVLDPLRCRMEHYLIDSAEIHRKLLDRCFWLLHRYLRYDICDIRNPGLANVEVPDLPTRIAWSVPEVVRYACLS
jgi:hypothetical protein